MYLPFSRLEKAVLSNSRQLNTEEDGYVVDMHFFDTGEWDFFLCALLIVIINLPISMDT